VDRCALFVDAGYALADGAMAVHGTRRRDSVSWDHAGLLKLLAGLARDRTGLPVLRCYWYETAAEGRRTAEHDALAEMPGLKLRLVNALPGRREGIESQLRRDLVTLAKSGAITDAFIASANEHIAEIVAEVQDLGLRVVILHIASDGGWTIPLPLRQECDDIVEISGVHLRSFVDLIKGAEPVSSETQYPTSTYGVRATDSKSTIGGALTHQGLPAAALPAPGAIYQVSDAQGYGSQDGSAPQPHYLGAPTAGASAGLDQAGAPSPASGQPDVGAPSPAGSQGAVQYPAQAGYDTGTGQQGQAPGQPIPAQAMPVSGFQNGPTGIYQNAPNAGYPGSTGQFGAGQAGGAQPGTGQHGIIQGNPSHGMPGQGTPGQGMQGQGMQGQGMPGNGAVQQGPMQQGPMQQGPMQQGAMQQGAMQQGAMQQGPMQSGPMQSGPMQQGPMQQGPMQQGPMQSGPIHTGPIQTGPLHTGPIQAAPNQTGPIQTGPPQSGPLQPGPLQAGSIQPGASQAGANQTGPIMGDLGPNGVGPNGGRPNGTGPIAIRPGLPQNGVAQNGAGQGGVHQGGFNQGGFNQNGANQNGFGQSGAGQNGTGQNGTGQNGTGQNGTGPNGYAGDRGLAAFPATGFPTSGYLRGPGANGTGHNGADQAGPALQMPGQVGYPGQQNGASQFGYHPGQAAPGQGQNGYQQGGPDQTAGQHQGPPPGYHPAHPAPPAPPAPMGQPGQQGPSAPPGQPPGGHTQSYQFPPASQGPVQSGPQSSGPPSGPPPSGQAQHMPGQSAQQMSGQQMPGQQSQLPNGPGYPAGQNGNSQAMLSRPPAPQQTGVFQPGQLPPDARPRDPYGPGPGQGARPGPPGYDLAPNPFPGQPASFGHHQAQGAGALMQPQLAGQQLVAPAQSVRPQQPVAIALPEAVKAAHAEGYNFGESVGRDAPGLWLEAVLARKPRMPSDLEARLLQGSVLPIDSLLHDEVRHSLRRGFWDALESARR
jgi:hypothetical protein